MCEFYWAFADYKDLMTFVEGLFKYLCEKANGGQYKIVYGESEIDFGKPFERLPLHESLIKLGGVKNPFDEHELIAKLKSKGIEPQKDHVRKLQVQVFDEFVEHQLIQPTFITEYPTIVSPLSRKNDDNPEIVDRFELFINGWEFANGFSELNDPQDQLERFEEQAAAKANGDEEACDVDHDYVRSLEYGMPFTTGCGIGIDRLTMLFTNSPSIRDVILFPQMRKRSSEN